MCGTTISAGTTILADSIYIVNTQWNPSSTVWLAVLYSRKMRIVAQDKKNVQYAVILTDLVQHATYWCLERYIPLGV